MAKTIGISMRRSALFTLLFVSLSSIARAQTGARPSAAAPLIEQQADAAREKGDLQASTKLYAKALALHPTWQAGWWYYGSLLYDANQYEASRTAYAKLVHLDPKSGAAWAMLGLNEYELHAYDQSLTDLRTAERLGVDDSSLQMIAQYHLAVLLNAHGDADGARLILSSLYLKGVRSEDLEVALGLSLLRVPVLPADLDPSRDALVHDAGKLAAALANHENERAELAFRSLLQQYPTTHYLHYAYGGLLAEEGKEVEAENQLKLETELNPDSPLAYLEWAFIAMKHGDSSEAQRMATRAIALNPESFLGHYILGNSLLLSGDAAAALVELKAAKQLAPDSPDIRYSLSRAYAKTGQPELARQEQAAFLALQRKNAVDRLALQKQYPDAPSVTGIRPTTNP